MSLMNATFQEATVLLLIYTLKGSPSVTQIHTRNKRSEEHQLNLSVHLFNLHLLQVSVLRSSSKDKGQLSSQGWLTPRLFNGQRAWNQRPLTWEAYERKSLISFYLAYVVTEEGHNTWLVVWTVNSLAVGQSDGFLEGQTFFLGCLFK